MPPWLILSRYLKLFTRLRPTGDIICPLRPLSCCGDNFIPAALSDLRSALLQSPAVVSLNLRVLKYFLLLRRKPKPSPWLHKHHGLKGSFLLQLCCPIRYDVQGKRACVWGRAAEKALTISRINIKNSAGTTVQKRRPAQLVNSFNRNAALGFADRRGHQFSVHGDVIKFLSIRPPVRRGSGVARDLPSPGSLGERRQVNLPIARLRGRITNPFPIGRYSAATVIVGRACKQRESLAIAKHWKNPNLLGARQSSIEHDESTITGPISRMVGVSGG